MMNERQDAARDTTASPSHAGGPPATMPVAIPGATPRTAGASPAEPPRLPPGVSIDEFRVAGKQLVDFIGDYWQMLADSGRGTAARQSSESDAPLAAAAGHPPVRPAFSPGDLLGALPRRCPEVPETIDRVMADVPSLIMPGIVHWQHPSFFGYFPANASPGAILGELLAAGLGVQGMLWSTSPACTELEMRVLDWLAKLIELPRDFMHEPDDAEADAGTLDVGGTDALIADAGLRRENGEAATAAPSASPSRGGSVIMGTASEGTLVALVAARHRARAALALNQMNTSTPPAFVVYTTDQAHSSVIKGAMVAGLCAGPEPTAGDRSIIAPASDGSHVRLIPTLADLSMDAAALARAIDDDIRAGRVPLCVVATVGTTGTLAIDDVDAIGRVCAEHRVWLHVDAAFAGCAAVCPEHRWMLHGRAGDALNRVDSLGFNPHKWLLTNFDCHCFYTQDRRSLTGALSITPEYLRNSASDAGRVIDYRDWQVPLGRRFRSLKLWIVMRTTGASGLREYIREHVRLGEVFESLVRADARFEVTHARTLSMVCFAPRRRAGESLDAVNARARAMLDRANATGDLLMTHTVVRAPDEPNGMRFILRMAIGGTLTQELHIRNAWRTLAASLDSQ
jgi:aromatic-L-amino-acid decarboxylase